MRKSFHLSREGEGARKDVEDEIELHLELRTREFEAQGMTPEEARQAALKAFGDRRVVEDQVRHLHDAALRERARRSWFSELRQDVAIALRGLRRAPGFTLVALLTLALGIGANTALFSVIRSVLQRPLPYPDAGRLVQVWSDHRSRGRSEPEWLTPPDYLDWRRDNTTFSDIAAYQGWGPDLTGAGDPVSLRGATVTGSWFQLLGARPALGRLFTMADDDAGAAATVVLSDALWRTQFGADSGIVNRAITLNGEPWTVIGVLPRDFRAPLPYVPAVFRTARRPPDSGCGRGCVVLRAIGRLKPGITVEQAQADLGRIAARIGTEFPETNRGVGAWLVPLQQQLTGSTRPALSALAGAVAFVLLIACVNLASLLLVRGAGRGRELGVRAALGAGRGRLVRQLVTEAGVLALLGGGLGLLLGAWGSRLLARLVPDSVRAVQEIRVDWVVIAFAAAITLTAGLLFGVLPAVRTVGRNLMGTLRTSGRAGGARGAALRSGLVVAELALAVVLLVGAGLLLRSFLLMQRVDLGYRTEGVATAAVFFPRVRYAEPARAVQAVDELLDRLRANPAVRLAEATDLPPLAGGGDQDVTAIPIGEPPRGDRPGAVWYRSVTPGYLQAMQMRLVAGRFLTPEDRAGSAPVAVVNQEAARLFWAGKDPIGRVLATSEDPSAPRATIVGVVASGRHDGPNQPYKPEMFAPIGQLPARAVTLVIEPARDLPAAQLALAQALKETDPLVPLPALEPMSASAAQATALPRLYATLVSIFAAAALLLAILGVYGVMAYSVAQRQREIGVRLALGASPAGIRGLVLGQGGRLTLLGTALGLLGAFAVARWLGSLLFGVGVFDWRTYLAVAAMLGGMTLLAAWLPARRAMRVDPLVVMREE